MPIGEPVEWSVDQLTSISSRSALERQCSLQVEGLVNRFFRYFQYFPVHNHDWMQKVAQSCCKWQSSPWSLECTSGLHSLQSAFPRLLQEYMGNCCNCSNLGLDFFKLLLLNEHDLQRIAKQLRPKSQVTVYCNIPLAHGLLFALLTFPVSLHEVLRQKRTQKPEPLASLGVQPAIKVGCYDIQKVP